jgi:aspartyl protease family protein
MSRLVCAGLLVILQTLQWAHAQTVSMSGSLGRNKAVLMIDGQTHTLDVGGSTQGVRLIGVDGQSAVVEVAGKRVHLQLGAAQVNLGGSSDPASGRKIVLTAGFGGHFVTNGSINGKTIPFLVDTGATNVSISQAQADQLGLKYRQGTSIMGSTANGLVPMHQITLNTVRIGEVSIHDVQAVVVPAAMPYVLLGNSFLSRFQMRRENDQLTLERRY